MSSPISHSALQELLGAYALDAVVDDEAAAVELHLRDCARCRATVSEFRETAALLATGHGPAPAKLWDGIVAAMDDAGPRELDLAGVVRMRPRELRQPRRAAVMLASVAAALVVALGVQGVVQHRQIDRMQTALASRTILSAALAAEGQPAARRTEMRSANGKLLARAVIGPDGTGYVWSDGLPRLERDRTYQLWAVIGTERVSVGVLGTRPDVVPFRVAGDVVGLAITEEVAGGVVATQHQPTATGVVVS